MTPLRLMSVVGARPNFMKIAPFVRAVAAVNLAAPGTFTHCLVHTGQHYDREMSADFFDALNIPKPDVDLEIGSGSHAEQVGRTMIAFEKVVREWKPDWVIVVGDVNATCACSITAKKEHLKLAHIEAGLRSFDLDMPEEINRMVTDRLSDLLFTPDRGSRDTLLAEGTPPERIHFVGNVMIDTMEDNRARAAALDPVAIVDTHRLADAGPRDAAAIRAGFCVLTLHRPSNVDDPAVLAQLVDLLAGELSAHLPLVWALHPRTRRQLETFGLWERVRSAPGLLLVRPLGYHAMLRLNMEARVMLTDSGGLQEECCVLGTPCITLRENTERPITLTDQGGVVELTGHDTNVIRNAFERMRGKVRREHRPELWDGRAAVRIAGVFADIASHNRQPAAAAREKATT